MRKFKKVLITGINGSGASYLADYILENHPEVEVHGTIRRTSLRKNIEHLSGKIPFHVHRCDLNDTRDIFRLLEKVKPDAIFHLASHANVLASFMAPRLYLENNISITINLLEAIRDISVTPYVMICSTSEVYGQVDLKNVPIKESCPIQPINPYAISKVVQDFLGDTYFKSYGMKIIRTRMFAYINPRRKNLFASSFADQVARIEAGLQKELLHGNLDSVRTLIDVRDAMGAYWAAMTEGKVGDVYNIGGTVKITVGDFLTLLKKQARCPIPSRIDELLLRPTDVTLQIPDITKFIQDTGWKPRYSLEESVAFLLDHAREGVENEKV